MHHIASTQHLNQEPTFWGHHYSTLITTKIGFLLDFSIKKTPNAKEQNNLLIHSNK